MLTLMYRPVVNGLCLIRRVVWSPDGTCLAAVLSSRISGVYSSRLLLWNLQSSADPVELANFDGQVMSIGFTNDGVLVAGLPNGTVRGWKPGRKRHVFSLGKKSPPNSRPPILATSRSTARMIVLHAPLYAETFSLHDWTDYQGHAEISEIRKIAYSANALYDSSGTVESAVLGPDHESVVFTNGRMICDSSLTGGSKKARQLFLANERAERLFLSPSQRRLGFIVGSKLCVGDLSDRKLTSVVNLEGHKSFVYAGAFGADDQTVVTGGQDGTTRVWNIDQQQEIACFDWDVGRVTTLAVSPDGTSVVVGGDGGNDSECLVMWDLD